MLWIFRWIRRMIEVVFKFKDLQQCKSNLLYIYDLIQHIDLIYNDYIIISRVMIIVIFCLLYCSTELSSFFIVIKIKWSSTTVWRVNDNISRPKLLMWGSHTQYGICISRKILSNWRKSNAEPLALSTHWAT